MHNYSQFTNLTGKGPKVYIRKPDKRTNKIYSSMQFKTLALPCLNYYYDLFYKEGKKIIPSNISDLLTARAFAYWISDDGGIGADGQTILYCQSYSLEEVTLLTNALVNNFKLRTRVHEIKPNQRIIVIPVKQIVSLKEIISPYIHYSMLYKIVKI